MFERSRFQPRLPWLPGARGQQLQLGEPELTFFAISDVHVEMKAQSGSGGWGGTFRMVADLHWVVGAMKNRMILDMWYVIWLETTSYI